jgi:hypothetical protein
MLVLHLSHQNLRDFKLTHFPISVKKKGRKADDSRLAESEAPRLSRFGGTGHMPVKEVIPIIRFHRRESFRKPMTSDERTAGIAEGGNNRGDTGVSLGLP